MPTYTAARGPRPDVVCGGLTGAGGGRFDHAARTKNLLGEMTGEAIAARLVLGRYRVLAFVDANCMLNLGRTETEAIYTLAWPGRSLKGIPTHV